MWKQAPHPSPQPPLSMKTQRFFLSHPVLFLFGVVWSRKDLGWRDYREYNTFVFQIRKIRPLPPLAAARCRHPPPPPPPPLVVVCYRRAPAPRKAQESGSRDCPKWFAGESKTHAGSCWCGWDEYCMCTPSLAIDTVVEVSDPASGAVREEEEGKTDREREGGRGRGGAMVNSARAAVPSLVGLVRVPWG